MVLNVHCELVGVAVSPPAHHLVPWLALKGRNQNLA